MALPGESAGQFKELAAWDERSLASISFGHEISATPLQMISAVSAIANGSSISSSTGSKIDKPVKCEINTMI